MIAIGADHGGYALKEEIKKYLDEKGIEYKDFGTYTSESHVPERHDALRLRKILRSGRRI